MSKKTEKNLHKNGKYDMIPVLSFLLKKWRGKYGWSLVGRLGKSASRM